jgi:hypothetical protein
VPEVAGEILMYHKKLVAMAAGKNFNGKTGKNKIVWQDMLKELRFFENVRSAYKVITYHLDGGEADDKIITVLKNDYVFQMRTIYQTFPMSWSSDYINLYIIRGKLIHSEETSTRPYSW